MPNKKNRSNNGIDRRRLTSDARGPKLNEILPGEEGGVDFQFKLESRCKICQKGHDFLSMVNALLASGLSYMDVMRSIAAVNNTYPAKQQVTYASLRNHQKRHLPYDSDVIRQIIEKRAGQQQRDFITGSGNMVDAASYAETMMYRAFQNLTNPSTFVEPRDGLAAAKTLYSITQNEDKDSSAVKAVADLNRLIGAVKAIVPEAYWVAIVDYLNNSEQPAVEATSGDEDDFEPSFPRTLDEDDEM